MLHTSSGKRLMYFCFMSQLVFTLNFNICVWEICDLHSISIKQNTILVCFYSQAPSDKIVPETCWTEMSTWHGTNTFPCLSVRSDSVMPSTGCMLFHSFWRAERIIDQWETEISSYFFFLCLIKIHLSTQQASSYTLEPFRVPLSVIYLHFNGAQSLLERTTRTN